MLIEDFTRTLEEVRSAHPNWFLAPPDRLATERDIQRIERELQTQLPAKFVSFLKSFGGGDFAFTNVFSADETSEWYIVDRNRDAANYLPSCFIAISDDETGGLYGFKKDGSACDEGVRYFDHESNEITRVMHADIFEYLWAVGLNRA